MKISCKIIKIDKASGAVLVGSLLPQDDRAKHMWISPDDLIGNYRIQETSNGAKGISRKDSIDIKPDNAQGHRLRNSRTAERLGQNNVNGTSTQDMIAASLEDEHQSHPELSQPPLAVFQKSNDSHFIPQSELQQESRRQSFTANSSPAQTRLDSSLTASDTRSTSLYHRRNEMAFNSDGSTPSRSTSSHQSLLSGLGLFNNPCSREFTDENIVRRINTNGAPSMAASGMSEGSARGQMLSGRFTSICSSRPPLLHRNTTIQSELDLLKQHGRALDVLMSTKDLGRIIASLQYLDRMHQRGVPVGPTAAKLVKVAAMTSRVLMEENLLRQMTAPIGSGGKGYNPAHAGMILCRMSPILGANLGRFDSPMINVPQLLRMGLNVQEVVDILPYVQLFEDDIILKSLSLKRELTCLY